MTIPYFRYHISESESEEEHRVVKSAWDKRLDELAEVVKRVRNHKKNKDMAAVLKDFEDLIRVYEKNKKLDTEVPAIFVRTITEIEDFANLVSLLLYATCSILCLCYRLGMTKNCER